MDPKSAAEQKMAGMAWHDRHVSRQDASADRNKYHLLHTHHTDKQLWHT
jgi:hypothetical protein